MSMYRRIDVATKDVADIAKRFGYRKRKASVVVTDRVTLTDLNWSGGSISRYTALDLATGAVSAKDHSRPAPWDNAAEGKTVDIPAGVAVVRTGTFLGKPGLMTIYVRPDNLPKLLPNMEDAT
jgi:hypothetical protein